MTDDSSLCPCCGLRNQCVQTTSETPVAQCWCFDVVVDAQQLAALPPKQRNRSCLCLRCAIGLSPEAQTTAD